MLVYDPQKDIVSVSNGPFLSLVYKLKITIRLFCTTVKLDDGYTNDKFTQFCARLTNYENATKSIVKYLFAKNEYLVFLIDETAKLQGKEKEITIRCIKK